jgi:hypothetical protein
MINVPTSQAPSQATNPLAQDDIARRMLAIWSGAMSVDRTLSLSQKRKDALNFLFADVFNFSLGQWEKFVDLIGGSEFLQTKLCKRGQLFDWAIKTRNCVRILNCVGTAEYITDGLAESLLAKPAKKPQSQSISLGQISLAQNKKTQAESTLCNSVLELTNTYHALPLNRDHYSDERHFGLVKNSHLWYCGLKVMKFMAENKKARSFYTSGF